MSSHPLAAIEVPLPPPPGAPIELLSDKKFETVQVLNACRKGLWATTAWAASHHDANAGSFFTKAWDMSWFKFGGHFGRKPSLGDTL